MPLKEMGLGLPSIRDRATQMRIEHLICNMNKDTERGYLAHFHALRILTLFNYWPTEALESNPLKMLTLRILRLASFIKGLELENIPPLLDNNDIDTSLRAASKAVDEECMEQRYSLQCPMSTKKFDGIIRQPCNPVNYSNKFLKHLAPLWETGVSKWNSLLTEKYLLYHPHLPHTTHRRHPSQTISRQQNQPKNTTPHGHRHPEIHTSPPCRD